METTDIQNQDNQNNELIGIVGKNKYIKSSKTGTVYKQYNIDSYYRDYYHNKKGPLVECKHCGKQVYTYYLANHMARKSCSGFNEEQKELYDKLRTTCGICGTSVFTTGLKRHQKSKKCLSHVCN